MRNPFVAFDKFLIEEIFNELTCRLDEKGIEPPVVSIGLMVCSKVWVVALILLYYSEYMLFLAVPMAMLMALIIYDVFCLPSQRWLYKKVKKSGINPKKHSLYYVFVRIVHVLIAIFFAVIYPVLYSFPIFMMVVSVYIESSDPSPPKWKFRREVPT